MTDKSNYPEVPHPLPTADPDRESDIDILARTLYGEARGERLAGITAVACVVVNRVRVAQRRGRFWWGNTVAGVCRKPWQFSCWNRGDPNRALIEAVDETDPVFRQCLNTARRAVAGTLADVTDGATHYHALGIVPAWARGRDPCVAVGRHLFYNDVD